MTRILRWYNSDFQVLVLDRLFNFFLFIRLSKKSIVSIVWEYYVSEVLVVYCSSFIVAEVGNCYY